jgi:hypothetical protein
MSVLGKAIRAKCIDCSCGQESEVRECTVTNCALYPFRMGKNPFTNRKGNPEFLRRKSNETNLSESNI